MLKWYAPEVKSRTQGSRPRTQKKSEAKDTKKSEAKDIGASVLRKKKVNKKFFQAIYKILTIQKVVLLSRLGQGNFLELDR